MIRATFSAFAALALMILPGAIGCAPSTRQSDGTIRVTGSDTMVNLAHAWAEAYTPTHPDVSLQVKGGGSGVGIAALRAGKVELATSSRQMTEKEIALTKEATGKEPKEYIVGRDALAIYVSKQNPIETISIEQLAEIYGEGGEITTWDQLGIKNTACADGEIIRISRQNSSGTYAYFKEAVLGKREYKQGTTAQSGSSDVVALVSNTPCAIGYSGMGYRSDAVKVLKVSKSAGEPGVAPSVESALDGTYPISRPLYLYTLGEPSGAIQEFITWILSDEGQKVVEEQGFVPLPQDQRRQ